MTDRLGDWMRTYSGRQFWPLDPRPEDVVLEDIVHHLACISRFGGAAPFRYSVADHSRLVSHLAPPELKLAALIHDFAEAYVGDQVRPIKRDMYFALNVLGPYRTFSRIEAEVFAAIAVALDIQTIGLDDRLRVVKHYDDLALAIEADAFGWDTSDWVPMPKPAPGQHLMYIADLDDCKRALWRECAQLGIMAAQQPMRSFPMRPSMSELKDPRWFETTALTGASV